MDFLFSIFTYCASGIFILSLIFLKISLNICCVNLLYGDDDDQLNKIDPN